MSDQTDHSAAAATAPYRHEITISVGGDSDDRIHIKTPPSVSTPTPSPRSIQSTTDEISNSTDDDHAVLAPKQKTSPSGVDNLAYENEHKTSQQRPMSSFGLNGNGTMKEPASNGKNGMDKPSAEAVNLELVNLNKTPTTNGHRDNGIPPKKKDTTEVVIGNSYNEYFVPVNEHKKYMRERGIRGVDHYGHSLNEPIEGIVDYNSWRKIARGEKLYVTKDKRLKTNWRKRILWIIGLTLCAAVLIVAILLATGTIGSEPEPIESRQFGSKDKLATAGIFGSGGKGKQNDTEYPSTPQPPGSTVPPHPPTTDENMIYVPNSADGKLKIENTEFLEEYKDHDSPIYHTIAGEIENGLMESLKDYKNVHVRVLNLTSGSIVVDYRVTWDDDEDISEDTLKDNLSKYLKENSNYIFSYFVPAETLSYTKVVDSCAMQTSEMSCDNGCEFDRQKADFVCRKSESESNAEPEPEVKAEPEPEVKAEPEPKSEAEPTPEVEPTAESEPKPEGESSAEVEPEPATAEPSAKQVESDIEHVTSEPVSKSEPSPEGEPSPEVEPTAESEPKPEGEPHAAVEPEPATAEPSAKQIEVDIEHVTSEPISKVEPSPEGEPSSDAEPKPEGEPTSEVEPEPATAEPSAKHVGDIEHVTSEPVSKSEPSPEGEPTADAEPKPEGEPSAAVEPEPTADSEPSAKHIDAEHKGKSEEDIVHVTSEPISKVEPSPEIVAEDSTAEPAPEIESSKKNNKNGKELNYDEEFSSDEKQLEGTTISLDGHAESTTRKQKYIYDFDDDSHSDDKEEKIETSSEQHEHSSEHSAVEGSTLRSSSERPAPVTEDLSDDTPLPTENYFKKVTKIIEQRTEVNVMDGTVTPSSINITSPTIYSTTAPIKLDHETTSQSIVRLAPYSTSEGPMYSVTENILEQSPFLPENENGDSPLNILTSSHILRATSHDDEEAKAKTLDIEDEGSSENDNANFISGPEIIPHKAYKIEGTSHAAQNSTTYLKEIEASEEKTEIPSDSTEIYHLQESRTHNHDNTEATKVIENQSDEMLEFSHHTEGGAVPTTVIPFSKSDDEDSTKMEQMTESDLVSLQEEKSARNEISSSSVSPSSSIERLEESTDQARNLNKNIDAISSESEASSTEQFEQLVSSTSERVTTSSEKIVEISPSAEPSIPVTDERETTVLPLESSSAKIDSTVSVEQSVSAVVASNETETKISPTSEQSDELSPTAEPSSSASETGNSTPPLIHTESDASSKSADLTKSEISTTTTTSEKIDVKSSTEPLPTEKSPTPEPVPSESTPSAEPSPSETTTPAAEPSSTEAPKLTDDALKVLPLQTTKKPDDVKTIENKTEKISEEETTESTTGHFLSKATFQLTNQSVETSLNSSLNSFNDSTNTKNEDDNIPISNANSTNDSSTVSTPNTSFGYSRCTAGQFECLNGTSITDGGSCISLSQRCDSNNDCSDSSDEADCEMKHCPGHFQCNDGSCLARSLVCDKIVHCHDGSDESNVLCNDWKCKFDEISCGEHGPCLPAILKCDGITHCTNQADETGCPDTCKNNEFYCSWQQKCIPETFVCDGKVDCFGGEDERLCDCPEDMFKCNTGRCVPHHYVCDGQPQCQDLSDDWDCFNITTVQRHITNTTTSMTDDIETTPETNANALQIKKPNGKFAFVCYDNWNLNYADMICKNFGFARSMDYTSVQINTTNKSLLKINNEFQQGDSMLRNMNETDSCTDDKIVALECEKYTCGNNLTRDKNVGDKNHTWPSLALAVNEISNVRCTATIVSPRWALASYSCILGKFDWTSEVEKTLNWYLQVNGSNYDDENESTELQQVNVVRIFKYPQTKFKHFLYSGDVVLLELDTPIEFGETVTAACLNDEPIKDDIERCISVGWFSEEGESTRKHYVKTLSATPLSTESCNSTSNYAGSLPDDLICMENDDKDEKCQINTDEGAPLLCYSTPLASWQVKGILSYRNDCRRHALPAVYSELTSSLLKWITKTIGNNEMVQ